MTKLTKGTWIVVADSEKALFMENLTGHPKPKFEIIRRADRPGDEIGTDRPGRRADGGSHQRSAMEETDWHGLARDRFAGDLAELLYGYARKGRFERAVIAAAPQLLGALRGELHKEVADKVVAEIPKTLTNHPLRKLETLIKAELDEG
jgi:protein required for attachment to host cells